MSNDRIARRAARLKMEHYPLICECGGSGCREVFLSSAAEYLRSRQQGLPLVHPDHGERGRHQPLA